MKTLFQKGAASVQDPGVCERCLVETTYERTKCFVCQKLVGKECTADGHVLCCVCTARCHQVGSDWTSSIWYYLAPATVENRPRPDVCDCCSGSGAGGLESSQAAGTGAGGFVQCQYCRRWLCANCRMQGMSKGLCMSCPARQGQSRGHTGISLAVPKRTPSESEVQMAIAAADKATQAVGSGKLSTGAYATTHVARGRGQAVAMELEKQRSLEARPPQPDEEMLQVMSELESSSGTSYDSSESSSSEESEESVKEDTNPVVDYDA